MTASVFVGVSVDGFIARANGALDFLTEGGGEPRGYLVQSEYEVTTSLTAESWPAGR